MQCPMQCPQGGTCQKNQKILPAIFGGSLTIDLDPSVLKLTLIVQSYKHGYED